MRQRSGAPSNTSSPAIFFRPISRNALPPRSHQDLIRFVTISLCGNSNPATFGAFLDYGAVKIASSSPERLISFDGITAEARPIKGTRRRDPDSGIDAELKAELLASRKDRAENVMIVDLLRNDLSRVCGVRVTCRCRSFAGSNPTPRFII